MAKLSELREKWMKNEEYREAHARLAPEFDVARADIGAWVAAAGLTNLQGSQETHVPRDVRKAGKGKQKCQQ